MKYKIIKKRKFPSNFRVIIESFRFLFPKVSPVMLLKIYRGSLKVFIILIFLLTAVLVGIDLKKNISSKEDIDLQRISLTQELKFWEDFIAKHKDYRDAYLKAAILEYKLGNTSKARVYVEKSLSLDPNSENGRKIEKFLNK